MHMRIVSGIYIVSMYLALMVTSAPAATKVFVLAGQSNMAGVGGYDGHLPAPYDKPQSNVKVWSNSNKGWVDLQGGFGHRSDWFGPEVSFGYKLKHDIFPQDEIFLVKYALTSTNLAVDWKSDGTGPCYNTLKSCVAAAVKNLTEAGRTPTVSGMIWMQGEGDTGDAYASAYAANLTRFIGRAREDFAAPNMLFVVGRINAHTWGTVSGRALVRAAQETVPRRVGNASWIDTDDLQCAYDGHYGTQGQIKLGNRFASQFAPIPKSSAMALPIIGRSANACIRH